MSDRSNDPVVAAIEDNNLRSAFGDYVEGVEAERDRLRAEITALHRRNHILGVALLWYVDEPNGHIAAQGLREVRE